MCALAPSSQDQADEGELQSAVAAIDEPKRHRFVLEQICAGKRRGHETKAAENSVKRAAHRRFLVAQHKGKRDGADQREYERTAEDQGFVAVLDLIGGEAC